MASHSKIKCFSIDMRYYMCPVVLWSAVVILCSLTYLFHNNCSKTSSAVSKDGAIKHTEEKGSSSLHYKPEHHLCSKVWDNPQHSNKEWESLEAGLKAYRDFHYKQLQKIDSNTSSLLQGVRTLTWHCYRHECPGLGDQFHQITFALLLSIVSKRVLFIHWAEQYKAIQHLHPNQIDWRPLGLQAVNDVLKNKASILQPISLADHLLSSTPHISISREIAVPFYRSFARFKTVKTLEAEMLKLGLTDILKSESDRYKLTFLTGILLRFLFTISRDIFTKLEQTQIRIGLNEREYVAVHIRTGFLGGLFEERGRFSRHKVSRSKISWEETLNCSLILAKSKYGKDAPILLATDSMVVKEWAADMYESRVITIDHVLQHSGKPHPQEESYEGMWIDFFLMSRAGYLVRGGSGFSVNAGALCSIPQSRQCTLTCSCKTYHVH